MTHDKIPSMHNAGLDNIPVLIDLANQLQDEWYPGCEINCSPALRAQMALLEEMSIRNKCVYSLFDFEKYQYIFHTKNLFDFVGLGPDQQPSKWDSSYLSLIEDRNPVAIYLALRKTFIANLTPKQREDFHSTTCGAYFLNLKGQRLRGMYRATPLTYDRSGNVKLSFDSVSNIKELMMPESGHWIRFAAGEKIHHWHSQTQQIVTKDILSPREIEFINLWKSGFSIPQIADHFHVSVHTVKNQLTNARHRLLARDNTSLAQLATLIGVLNPAF
ncbi:response regulator transcription factor [Parapedobacter sp.]|uniref:response regulator transcription factor n=1 Tax=Parapedobacter sp. TaxID=1958893 RepID=UPI002D7E41A7|nr:LuxR C-terminal-related transcriptional regulator [Parapedobacter sp.]